MQWETSTSIQPCAYLTLSDLRESKYNSQYFSNGFYLGQKIVEIISQTLDYKLFAQNTNCNINIHIILHVCNHKRNVMVIKITRTTCRQSPPYNVIANKASWDIFKDSSGFIFAIWTLDH